MPLGVSHIANGSAESQLKLPCGVRLDGYPRDFKYCHARAVAVIPAPTQVRLILGHQFAVSLADTPKSAKSFLRTIATRRREVNWGSEAQC